jgi:hypothetical protein
LAKSVTVGEGIMVAAMDSGTSGEVVDFAQAKRGANLDDGSRQ